MKLPKLASEPLVHFVALGALLYVGLTWGGSPPDPSSRVISIGASERERIAESFSLTMGRSPSDAELDVAIDAFVREEVLYREALRLGLDEGDAIVRWRMVSKMDLSASLAAEMAEPSDEVLRAFLQDNADDYAQHQAERSKVSFDQAFFASEASARASIGDESAAGSPTSLPATIEVTPMRDVEAQFGLRFAEALNGLEPKDGWQGPVASGFGWHLVRLRERELGEQDFDTLRPVLANDWRTAEIQQRKERAYQVLRSAYRIDVDR